MNLDRVVHVGGRGVRRGRLFESKADFARFLRILGRVCADLGVTVLAYCLMDNHYHLLVVLPEELESLFLKKLNSAYAQSYNLVNGFSGHVFEARCWSFERWGLSFLAHIMRYIHLNPVKPGMARNPADYPYSSYAATIGLKKGQAWLNPGAILRFFSEDMERAKLEYQEYVEAYSGNSEVWAIVNRFETVNAGRPRAKRLLPKVELLALTSVVLANANAGKNGRKNRLEAIDLVLYGMSKVAPTSLALLAIVLNTHKTTIARRIKRTQALLAACPDLRAQLEGAISDGLGLRVCTKR